ncbi:cytochrome c biogenesis protein CcsA [Isosphaeraceae bacterium EP7]
MDRLSVLCFGGTYALALLGDLARVAVRGSARWYLTLGLTALAWLVQGAYLANRGLSEGMPPVTSASESLLVLSWLLALAGLYLMARSSRSVAVGVFVLPAVLAMIVMAGTAPHDGWSDWGGARRFWGMAHGLFLLFGAASSCVGFLAGLMYLIQSRRLKQKRPPQPGFALPSLEQSERLNRGAITLAFPLLTLGLVIGMALIASTRPADGSTAVRWTDPKVLSTGAMWLAFAVLLHARFRPSMRGRRMMVLTMVAFAFLAFTWVGVDLLFHTDHGTSLPAVAPAVGGAS